MAVLDQVLSANEQYASSFGAKGELALAAGAPIVMLTAYDEKDLVAGAIEVGVFAYLVKPFREQDLVPAIHAARARFSELQALRDEADSLAEALEARKAIERAKGS